MRDQLHTEHNTFPSSFYPAVAMMGTDLLKAAELREPETGEVLSFLAARPVQMVVMASFIKDNGLRSELNRGRFYGFRNAEGRLEGVALIGHTTLIEARTDDALRSFALQARSSETPIHLIMSHGTSASEFWGYYSDGFSEPRLTCTERLFEVSFPFMVRKSGRTVRLAAAEDLLQVAEAQAVIAFMECGVDPLAKDREGFLKRVLRRIEQGRVFVVFENGKLVFKADVIADTTVTAYLEGIYVAPEYRGRGIGSDCLAEVTLSLLDRVENVCLLSNVEFNDTHKTYIKAGYRPSDECTTLFV